MVLNGIKGNLQTQRCRDLTGAMDRGIATSQLQAGYSVAGAEHPAIWLTRQVVNGRVRKLPRYTWAPHWPTDLEVRVRTFPSGIQINGESPKDYDYILGPSRLVLQWPFKHVPNTLDMRKCFGVQTLKTEGPDADYDPATDVLADPMLDAADDLLYRKKEDPETYSGPNVTPAQAKAKLEWWARNRAGIKRTHLALASSVIVRADSSKKSYDTMFKASGNVLEFVLGTKDVPIKTAGGGFGGGQDELIERLNASAELRAALEADLTQNVDIAAAARALHQSGVYAGAAMQNAVQIILNGDGVPSIDPAIQIVRVAVPSATNGEVVALAETLTASAVIMHDYPCGAFGP